MTYRGKHQPRGPFDDAAAIGVRAAVFARNVITGTNGDDLLNGTAGDDVLRPKRGQDTVDGGAGVDTLRVDYSRVETNTDLYASSFSSDAGGISGTLSGGPLSSCLFSSVESLRFTLWDGDDSVFASFRVLAPGATIEIDGGGGVNTFGLTADELRPRVSVTFAVDADGTAVSNLGVFVNFQQFALFGGIRDDDLAGGGGDDLVYGNRGDDVLAGGDGDDVVSGDRGGDTVAGGGGADRFEFQRARQFDADGLDRITDFSRAEGDTIDLSRIDADRTLRRDQAFTFIGDDAFTGAEATGGELRAEDNGDGTFTVEGDRNRDGVADFQFLVTAPEPLVVVDFIL